MMYRLTRTMCITICICLFATGCLSNSKEFMPDQVIENALRDDALVSYYAESETFYYENEELESKTAQKEWFREDGWMRFETIDENDDVAIIVTTQDIFKVYDTVSNELVEGRSSEFEDMPYAPKEIMLMNIEAIQETHDITYVGEEKMIGRKAHRIKAIPRDTTSLVGEQEFWIDAEYWITLKHIAIFGDSRNEMNFTHFEAKKELEDHLFDIEVTEEMTVLDLDELMDESTITLEEMIQRMDHSFMYFDETDTIDIHSITTFQFDENSSEQFTIEYTNDGLPFLTLTIVDGVYVSFFEDPEELQINEHTVYYTSEENLEVYEWNMDGVRYEVWLNDPSVNKEEMVQMIEQMKEATVENEDGEDSK